MPLSTKSNPSRPRAILCGLLTGLSLIGIPLAEAQRPPAKAKNALTLGRVRRNEVTTLKGAPQCVLELARFNLHGETELALSTLWDPSPKSKDAGSFIGSEWRLLLFDSHVEPHSPTSITLHAPTGNLVQMKDRNGDGKFTQRGTERWAEKIEGVVGGYLYHTYQGFTFRYEDSQLYSITLPASDGLKGETFDLTYATPLQPGALTRRSDEVDVLTYTLQPSNEHGIISKLNWGEHELTFYVSDEEEIFHGYRPIVSGTQLTKIELDGQKLLDVSYQQTDGKAEGIIVPTGGLHRVDFDLREAKEQHFPVAFHPITEQVYWANGDAFFFSETSKLKKTLTVSPDGKMIYIEHRWNQRERCWEILKMEKDGTARLTSYKKNDTKRLETLKGCRVDLDAENRTFEFVPGDRVTTK